MGIYPKKKKKEILIGKDTRTLVFTAILFTIAKTQKQPKCPSIHRWMDIYIQTHIQCVDKGLYSQSYGFTSSHVRMWELDCKEGWASKNWYFWIMVLEKTFESPLDYKIKPVNPKGNQAWIFTGRTDAEAEAPIFGHLMQKADSLEKTLMLGKTEGNRRRAVEDEMVR